MPFHNPRCPKCGSHVRQIEWLKTNPNLKSFSSSEVEYGKALFKCRWCGHKFEGFAHRMKAKK